MLIVSAPYLEKKIHPTVIIRGLQRALEDIVAHYYGEVFCQRRVRARAGRISIAVCRDLVHRRRQRSCGDVARDRVGARHQVCGAVVGTDVRAVVGCRLSRRRDHETLVLTVVCILCSFGC
jgi:hypothetical protein